MKIQPISQYYLKGGKFHLKSQFGKWFRIGLLCGAIIGAAVPSVVANSSEVFRYTPTREEIQRDAFVEFIQRENKQVPQFEAIQIVEATIKYSKELGLDPKMILAIMKQESNFTAYSISSSGALGLMQIIARWHVDKLKKAREVIGTMEPMNIHTNVWVGTQVFKQCLESTKLTKKALTCYNGNGTKGYEDSVLAHYGKISQLRGV